MRDATLSRRSADLPSSCPQEPAGARQNAQRGHGAKSAAVRERAVLALLSERSIKAAARRAGVDEATLRRWLAGDDGFRAAYDEARRTIFQSSMNRIQGLAELAAETLHDLLREKKHPAVRLGAARLVTEIGMHQHDADTILTKLGELEAAQRQQFRNGRG